MKVIIYISLIGLFFNINIKEVVLEFHQINNEKEENFFIEKYKNSEDPSVLAYIVSLKMKQAKYTYNPIKKLSIFNKNKAKLELLIKQNPTNIHLRYVRLLIQNKAPRILGYFSQIDEDKKFIKAKLKIKDKSDFLDPFIKHNLSL